MAKLNAVVTADFYSTGERSYALTVAYPRGTANAKVAVEVAKAVRDIMAQLALATTAEP